MKAKDLRNSILQLAVQGKLVEQDPADEPASVLLEKIRAERAKLIKEKKIKAPKGGESVIFRGSDGKHYEKRIDAKRHESDPVCIEDEIPFEIPDSWEWARLETALTNRDAERIPVSVAERERRGKVYDYYGASGVIDRIDDYLFDKPLLLIGEDGANLLNRSTPIAFIARGKYWVNNHAHVLDGITEQYLEYIALFINSISLAPYITGTAQPKMNQQRMGTILIPLPPENEQLRILSRVSSVFSLLADYDILETVSEKLDTELPDKLRKSILQMAVQGKLVPQNPNDEPASVLLDRIRKQRRQLITEGKMKPPKGGESVIYRASDGSYYEKRIGAKGRESNPVCIDDEIPFAIPESWEWVRMSTLVDLLSGADLPASQYNDVHDGIPYLTGASNFTKGKLIENRWTKSPKRISIKGDLLFTCKGTVGTMAMNTFTKAHIARQIMAIRPVQPQVLFYLTVYLQAMVEQIRTNAKGVIPGIERSTLLDALVPMPPEQEQWLIGQRIKKLLSLPY